MKLKNLFAAAALAVLLTSCTVNDEGDLEFTWLFWTILIVIALFFIISIANGKKEADRKGITFDQMVKERQKETEKREKTRGLEVEYLGGYPNWYTPCKVNFSIDNSNILLTKGTEKVIITKDMIVAISNEKSGVRSVGKTAAGAIVGGVLTGGIGLIVGGALGARRKDTSEVYVTYKYNGVELTLNLKPGKNTDKVYAWINSVFA